MTYETAGALRIALEQRLLNQSQESGISLDRLRRRVIFERVVARLETAEPRQWVLKGGMALEVRLRDDARLTKDIDMGLRSAISEAGELQERLVEAMSADPFTDRFVITVGPVSRLMEDGAGHVTWRAKVAAKLAGRPFGGVQLDVSPAPTNSNRPTLCLCRTLLPSRALTRHRLRSSAFTATLPRSITPCCGTSVSERTATCAISLTW